MGGDDSEPVDVLPQLTEACKPKCTTEWKNYEACIGRLEKKKEGDCEAWYFDHLKCLDKCRAPQLFKHTSEEGVHYLQNKKAKAKKENKE